MGIAYHHILKLAHASAKIRFEVQAKVPAGKTEKEYQPFKDKRLQPVALRALAGHTGVKADYRVWNNWVEITSEIFPRFWHGCDPQN